MTKLSIVAAISAVASLFLCSLVYYHAPVDITGTHLLFLPALNALFPIALVTGFCFILGRRISEHRAAMFTAFVFSSLSSSSPWSKDSRPGVTVAPGLAFLCFARL